MLNLYGPINNLGYGVFFSNMAKELVEMTECSLTPIGRIGVPVPSQKMQESMNLRRFWRNNPSICFYHEHLLNNFTGKPMIGFPTFEGDKLNPVAENLMDQLDYIIVPSSWAKGVVHNQVAPPCDVVPEGVDPLIFNPDVKPSRKYYDPDTFTIVNVGKFEKRKGSIDILDLLRGPLSTKQVRVLAMWTNPFIPQFGEYLGKILTDKGFRQVPVANRYIFSYGKATLEVIPPVDTQGDVASIMKCGNLAIYPTRAEGWGLPILEGMSCGVPTIASYNTAMMDYLTDENSRPLRSFTEEAAEGTQAGNWMVPDFNELAQAVLDGIAGKVPTPPKEIGEQWSWHNAALKLKSVLIDNNIMREEEFTCNESHEVQDQSTTDTAQPSSQNS